MGSNFRSLKWLCMASRCEFIKRGSAVVNLNFMLHTHVKSKSGRLPDGTGRTDSDTLYYRSPEHEMALLSLKFFCNSKVFGDE